MNQFSFAPIKSSDLEWARLLHNDPDVLSMLTDPHIVTQEEQKRWFSKLKKSSSSKRLVVWKDKERVGLVRIDQLDNHNHSVGIGLDIHKDFRGQGYAKKIYRALFDMFFIQGEINRIWLLVAEYNSRARHIYKSLGFKEEGIQRQALFKNKKYYDYIFMSILYDEYLDLYYGDNNKSE